MMNLEAMTLRKGSMKPGEFLSPNEALVSSNGVFKLCYEKEGNLALYSRAADDQWMKAWESQTTKIGKAVFQNDGQLAIIPEDGSEPWVSGYFHWIRDGKSRNYSKGMLVLQDDGNLVVYDSANTACWATNTWTARYALLIGVEDYAHFNDQKLRAGRNDVLAMWKLCRRLGYRPEHIRVHTSPRLTAQEIKDAEVKSWLSRPENTGKTMNEAQAAVDKDLESVGGDWSKILGEATSSAINGNLQWFRDQLGAPFHAGRGYLVPGILYYSGHGAKIGGQLALCPSDVSPNGGKLENALMFKDIEQTLTLGYGDDNEHNPVEFLTVVLDCCFAAAQMSETEGASNTQVATSLSLPDVKSASKTAHDPIHPWLQRRIFCAARDDEQGFQSLLGGRWHGAFTWAFTQALEQWMTRQSAAALFPYVDISHAELLMRARMLLEALSFQQHPVLMDTFANTPVFWSGLARVEAHDAGDAPKTNAEPTAERPGIQLDPNLLIGTTAYDYSLYSFALKDKDSVLLGSLSVASIGNASATFSYQANKEYWFVQNDDAGKFFSKWNSEKLNVCSISRSLGKWANSVTDPMPGGSSSSSATSNARVSWTEAEAPVGSTMYAGDIGIDFSNYTAPTTTAKGSVTVIWYRYLANAPSDNTYAINDGQLLSRTAPTKDSTKKWYANSQTMAIPQLPSK